MHGMFRANGELVDSSCENHYASEGLTKVRAWSWLRLVRVAGSKTETLAEDTP